MLKTMMLATTALLALAACQDKGAAGGGGGARDTIRIVGSSTVYPFATAVAEQFVNKNPGFKSPIVESTGTGGGMKLFCAGVGAGHPDIEDASRRIKQSEYDDCRKNGVGEISEIQVGIDGIAFAEANNGPKLQLTPADIYKALAAKPFGKPNTAKTWADVNPTLPPVAIKVFGPPSTSGTRDALAELILTKGCDSDPAMKALKDKNEDQHKTICTSIREDGAYVDTGENDNLIVQKLEASPQAVGIFGYSYLEENAGRIHGVPISGVTPTYATISDFSYPGARPLYIYVKNAHLKAIPGIREYVAEWARAWGKDGYLTKRGLIASPDAIQATSAELTKTFKPLNPADLK